VSDARASEVNMTDRSMAVFDRRVESAADARSWLTDFLVDRDIDGQTGEDAALLVSELVTNALRHGDGAAVLRVVVTESEVQLSVTDSGDAEPRLLPRDPDRIGGLGLVVVDRIAADWGVASFPGGKTVWAVLNRRRP
jgi:anti-sigma regulatory factor (Ser/Thr protein kinase)